MSYQELIRVELAANSNKSEYKRDYSKFQSKSTTNWDLAQSFDVDQSQVEDDDEDEDDDMTCMFFN